MIKYYESQKNYNPVNNLVTYFLQRAKREGTNGLNTIVGITNNLNLGLV